MATLDETCETSEIEVLLGMLIRKSDSWGNYVPRCNFSPALDEDIPDCIKSNPNAQRLIILNEKNCIGCKYHYRDYLKRVW